MQKWLVWRMGTRDEYQISFSDPEILEAHQLAVQTPYRTEAERECKRLNKMVRKEQEQEREREREKAQAVLDQGKLFWTRE